jgi:signal peptidase I
MKRKIIALIAKIIIIEVVFFLLFFVIFGFSRVKTNAMYPNINGGDLAFYYHLDKSCHPGDVVTVKSNNERSFLRVIACGGDEVTVTSSNAILVNGSSLDIDREFSGSLVDIDDNILGEIKYPYKVPEGYFFLVGDNRYELNDSRVSGAYSESQIDGKVISILRTRGI